VLSKGGDIFNSLLISQSIVGIAGGATRAALVQHQARRDNMADVAAKDSSQVWMQISDMNLVLTWEQRY